MKANHEVEKAISRWKELGENGHTSRERAAIAVSSFGELVKEIEVLRNKIAERKIIDRAKGKLMKANGWSEPQAFKRMQRAAMDRRMRMAEIAEMVLAGEEIEW